jgi:signal transduction histidine kinase
VVLEAGDGWLCFEVRDAGPGFEPDAAAKFDGTGLQGMRDRLAALGGDLSITSAPGQGTTLRGRVPACQSASSRSGVSSLLET